MAKIIDITDKLNFEQKPQIKIKDITLTVNNEAVALLKILPRLNGNITAEALSETAKTLFEPSELEKIQALGLSMNDFAILIEAAARLIAGENGSGEAATRTTT